MAGSGKIQQKIQKSSNYYIAVGNLNSEDVEVIIQMLTAHYHYTIISLLFSASCYDIQNGKICAYEFFLGLYYRPGHMLSSVSLMRYGDKF
jgi:hypothetical protein